MHYVLIILLCFITALAQGQIVEERMEQLAEIYIEENEGAGDFTEVYEWMTQMRQSKVNLNKAGIAELIELPFLNTSQVSQIIQHRQKFGDFISLYELQVLPSFSKETINKVLPFIFVNKKEETFKELLKKSRQSLTLRYLEDFEKPRGFNSAYKGKLGKTYLRFQNIIGKRASLGFVVENDAYEPILVKGQMVDYFSFCFQLKETGSMKNLVLGDYQANFGQGLILGAGFGGYKSYEATSMGSIFQGIKKYSSVNENLFLRGAATTIRLRQIEFTPFVSYNKIDATIKSGLDTSVQEVFFHNTQTSGFHRTESELANKDNLIKMDYGLQANYKFRNLNLGLTYINTTFSESKKRGEELYKILDVSGKEFDAISISYNYINKNTFVSGEFALQDGKKMATVNKLLMSLSNSSEVLFIYRNYAAGYFSPNGKSFGEKTNLSNEKGVYMGIKSALNYQWSFSLYGDYYTFPWLRYGVYAPTRGKDFALKINRTFNKKDNLYIRLKSESREVQWKGEALKKNVVAHQLKGRAHFNYSMHHKISAATRLEVSSYEEQNNLLFSKGILFYQELKYSINRKWKASIRGVVFNTEDYNSRIYTYEQNVLYHYAIPAFYDKGFRTYLLLQYKPIYTISFQAKLGRTNFTDRVELGSGNDLIYSSNKTSLTIQARIKW